MVDIANSIFSVWDEGSSYMARLGLSQELVLVGQSLIRLRWKEKEKKKDGAKYF